MEPFPAMGERYLSSSLANPPIGGGGAKANACGWAASIGKDVGVGPVEGLDIVGFVPRPKLFSWSFLDVGATKRSVIFSVVVGTTVGIEELEFLCVETMSAYDGLACHGPDPGLQPVGVRDLLVGLLFMSMAGWPVCSKAGLGADMLAALWVTLVVSLGGMNDPGMFMLGDLDEVVGELFLDCWGAGGVLRPTPFLGACENDMRSIQDWTYGLVYSISKIFGFWPYYTTWSVKKCNNLGVVMLKI